jgi:hypothetical protein
LTHLNPTKIKMITTTSTMLEVTNIAVPTSCLSLFPRAV